MNTPSRSPEPSAPGPAATGISHILVVCTGNICRSPFGEIQLRALLADTGITVSSAGVYAMEGEGVDSGMLPELSSRGLSPEGFVAHQISTEDVDGADLIVTMSRRQRSFIVDEWPHARRKTLLLASAPVLAEAESESASAAPRSPGYGRRASRPLTSASGEVSTRTIADVSRRSLPEVLDIPDPFRKTPDVYAEAAALVEEHSRTLALALRTTIGHYLEERA